MRIRLFAFALAATVLTSLSACGGAFTGPGLWTDETKWGGSGVPTFTSSGDWSINGYCGETNKTLYGGAYMHIGRSAAGYADIENCIVSCKTFRVAHWKSGVYRQKGGTFYDTGTAVGSKTAYDEAGLYFEDADVVLAGDFNIGNEVGKTGGDASAAIFHIKGGTFKQPSGSRTVKNGARAVFEGLESTVLGSFGVQYGTLAVVDSPGTISTSERSIGTVSDKTGTFAVTNSTINHSKAYFGTAARALGVLDIAGGAVFTQNYQLYVGSGNTGTGIVHIVDSKWMHSATSSSTEGPNIGSGANSYGEFHITGADSSMSDISVWKIGAGSNSTGRVIFDGIDWSKMKKSNFRCAMSQDAKAYIDYRDIAATNAYTLWQGYGTYAGSKVLTTIDNCHYANTANTYFGSATKGAVVVCNGSTFDISCSKDIWMPNNASADVSFFVTNSPMFRIDPGGNYLKHEKANAQLHFTFHDSTAYICTNGTFNLAQGAGSEASFTLSGDATLLDINDIMYINGQVTFNLDGGVFRLGKIQSNSGYANAPTFNFNGGTLRSKSAQSSWFPATSTNYVCEGGAVFDARHNVTVPGLLRHGGEAAKDGGVTKKGSGTLTLSSTTAHTFTGDIVVEEGTLVATAFSNWTLAAGQKIGGAGTLKVSPGFTAGGVRFDAAWEGGLTVYGDVAFAPGSSVDVTGISRETEGSRFTILTADSISGANCISTVGLPDGWKLRASATSLSIGRDAGLILIVR